MRLTANSRNLMRMLEHNSHFNPSPLSVKQFIDFGNTNWAFYLLFLVYIVLLNINSDKLVYSLSTPRSIWYRRFFYIALNIKTIYINWRFVIVIQKINGLDSLLTRFFLPQLNFFLINYFKGRSANEVRSFEFLRKELPVRLANIMQEINLLPENLIRMPSVNLVQNWYVKSFNEVLEFEDVKTIDKKNLLKSG